MAGKAKTNCLNVSNVAWTPKKITVLLCNYLTYVDKSESEGGQQTLQRCISSFGKYCGRVERHDVDSAELLSGHGNAAAKRPSAKTRNGEKFRDAADERCASKCFALLFDLTISVVLIPSNNG